VFPLVTDLQTAGFVSSSYSNIALCRLLDLAFEILFISKTFQYLLKDIKHVSHYIETRGVCVCVCVCEHTHFLWYHGKH